MPAFIRLKVQSVTCPASMTHRLKESIESLHAFLQAQKDVLGVDVLGSVRKSHKDALVGKISGLATLTADDATAIVQCLAQGPWTPEEISELSRATNDQVLKATAAKPPRRPNQTCACFAGYLSRKDCETLGQPDVSHAVKPDVLATRCVKMGLVLPSAPWRI